MDSNPMSILYLSSFENDWNGGQKSLINLISNLDRHAFKIHVVVPADNGNLLEILKDCNIEGSVIEFPKVINYHLVKKIISLWALLRLVKKYRIDIIHTDGPRNTFYAGIVAKLTGIPLIWHVRASNRDRFDRLLYYLSAKIILVANALRSRFDFNDSEEKFITIHNGVDLFKYRPEKQNKFVREKFKVGRNDLLIVVTARIERLKGQIHLIKACSKLKEKISSFYILLAGEITDYPYLRECKNLAVECDLNEKVIFPGQLDDVKPLLSAADIVVLPSLFEAFPRAVIEGMAAGKPVIATNVGGNAEAIENGISGFLVLSEDSDTLADKILLLAKSRSLREKLGNNARMHAVKKFGIKDKVKQIEKLYRDVL